MKVRMLVILLFISIQLFSQKNERQNDPDSIAATIIRSITANDSTDRQKVASIFAWITSNIEYNTGSRFGSYFPAYASDWDKEYWEDDTTNAIPSLDKRVAAIVLRKRVAVCDGYARLFKTLCGAAGIKAEVVSGFGRANGNERNFTTNHRWNAVFIDTSWYLLDATWAAGYIGNNNRFQRNFNSYYFLTPPEKFFNDHYPEDHKWILSNQVNVPNEFKRGPFQFPIFQKYFISSVMPASGIINARLGDSIVFELTTRYPNKKLWVSDFEHIDSASVVLLQCCGISLPENTVAGNKVRFTFHLNRPTEWLHVIYDDEIILRYRVNLLPPASLLADQNLR